MTAKRATGPRKKSPRTKGLRTIPGASSALKELWKTPEFREKMRLAREKQAEIRKNHPNPALLNRNGVPDGMRRAQAEPLWIKARALADKFIGIMKDKGELPSDEVVEIKGDDGTVNLVAVPGSDGGKAEAALREAFVLAVGPTDQKIKIQAINTVLNFTKSRPEAKSKLTLSRAEDFLDEIAKDRGV